MGPGRRRAVLTTRATAAPLPAASGAGVLQRSAFILALQIVIQARGLIQVPFLAIFGTSPVASQIPFAIIGATVAPLTWAIANDAGARRSVAIGAALMTAIPAAATVFMGQPDNFSLYQPIGAAALWMGARALRGDRRAFALGGRHRG